MEIIHEIIPFAREILSQKPSRRMVKVYLTGSVIAFFGVALGLVEAVCQPFTAKDPLEEELARLEEREQLLEKSERPRERMEGVLRERELIQYKKKIQQPAFRPRDSANRLHAS